MIDAIHVWVLLGRKQELQSVHISLCIQVLSQVHLDIHAKKHSRSCQNMIKAINDSLIA